MEIKSARRGAVRAVFRPMWDGEGEGAVGQMIRREQLQERIAELTDRGIGRPREAIHDWNNMDAGCWVSLVRSGVGRRPVWAV